MHLLPSVLLLSAIAALIGGLVYAFFFAPANANGAPLLLWLLTAQAGFAIILTLASNFPLPPPANKR